MQKFLLAMILAAVVSSAGAKDVVWRGAANDGNIIQTAANWVGGKAPGSADIAVFRSGRENRSDLQARVHLHGGQRRVGCVRSTGLAETSK